MGSNSNRPIPMTSSQRGEREFLPLQRDHRLFVLTDTTDAMQNFYALMSVATPCQSKLDCCQVRDKYLGRGARRFVNPQCDTVSQECVWNVTPYSQADTCNNTGIGY